MACPSKCLYAVEAARPALMACADRDEGRHARLDIVAMYRDHAGPAHRLALRILRDHDLAADAVQEAFLSLWLLREHCDGDSGETFGLLRTLVHRRAVDILRHRAAGPATIVLPDAESVPDERLDVHDQVVGILYAARVYAAIGALDPARRAVLVLAAVHGQTQSEIAAALGIPIGTVKSRLARARIDLRGLLTLNAS